MSARRLVANLSAAGLPYDQVVHLALFCQRVKAKLPVVVSPVAKARQKCAVTRQLLREFTRLGIGTVGVVS